MNTFKMEIITPSGKIFDQMVKYASIPGSEGEFGVLSGHAAMVSMLAPGVVEIEDDAGAKEAVAINWGYVEVNESSVSVLADGAVLVTPKPNSDLQRALADAQALLKAASDSDTAIASAMAKIEHIVK